MSKNKHIGSSLDEFLSEQGILEEVEDMAMARVVGWQIQQIMKETHVSKSEMADRMHTSRAQLDRILNPRNDAVLFDSMQRAAAAVGHRIRLLLEPAS